ncbi:endoribonuclease L-PSP family protein [Tritrichomonas foetus]|uniref:Endoribonuclease L-PSP family protein n=1 Tax=Tritrichomonas foetus TaxID=1144522 RepID=A0A1J4KTH4_9EUKA|nr:endoribonuclease L-PSP family protein [Tritrichomonas foetus]|eukprot:OHT12966.1 endoribonuclease L-PSP family protein [Tritrichomonas foetus]
MSHTVIATPDAPGAIGPYVQGRVVGNTCYTSGCVAIDPHGGPNPESIEDQCRLCLNNLNAILTAGGFKKEDVVKTTVYLLDMNDFATINKIYADFFGDHKPCRTCIQAGKLPGTFKFEIDAIAVKA